jgi:hypothetical protein
MRPLLDDGSLRDNCVHDNPVGDVAAAFGQSAMESTAGNFSGIEPQSNSWRVSYSWEAACSHKAIGLG